MKRVKDENFCTRARISKSSYALGFEGKMLIHPNQIKIANKVFSPTKKDVKEAKEMLSFIQKSSKKGVGAVAFSGKLLDIVTIKQAKNIVELDKLIKEKNNYD